ncbi:DNA topoisomerase 1-like isoform X6 [Trifolium pratense]|uniref:DNA topoisomerase 1-like isoform X6 n=1 Tax=Trifolium pratense TaxID=57577 RepID=UPI001E6935C8|nr:DNA topoisomerase 1-like isoform X6 [Trifolium pratense]
MIQFQRTFFFTNTTSSPTLRNCMFQLRSLHNPLISPHLPSLVNLTTNAVQHRNCFSFRSFSVTNFNTLKSVTSISGFGLPFRVNGVGRSLRYLSAVPEKKSKWKKPVKAVAVRGKDKKDASSGESVDKNVKNVELEKSSLSEEIKSDKQDSKINNVKKTKKKKPPSKKKDVKTSAATDSTDSSKAVGEEVSKKSPSKGKKKTNVKESSAVSTSKEIQDGSASTRSKKKDVNSSQVDLEKPLGNFTGKPLYPPTGKSVMVVESATKAKVIQRYLGDMYEVLPSYGHVRDLAARSGSVRPDDDFSMVWEVPSSAWTQLKSINLALSGAENLIIASDPDREGEAIAWHIIEMLHQQGALRDNVFLARVVFHEITEQSIKTALQAPREIDVNLVHAYLARRALDYLIGFNISPLLWRKLPGCQSAGRVQSAALSLICDREMEIDQFKPKEYWTMEAKFDRKERISNKDVTFRGRLTHFDSNKLTQFSITSDGQARDIEGKVNSAEFQVISMKKNKVRRNPPTPYITSTLQQDAGNKLKFSASQTMKIAQKLYEGVELSNGKAVGLITYMRTDGFHISDEAVANIRSLIIERYGQNFVAQSPPKYFKKVKNAQEAHEAIRPTDIRYLPSMLAGVLDEESLKLYTLIWSRTVSCQMEPAILEKIQVDIGNADKSIMLRSASSRVEFPGYQAVFTDIVTEAGQDRDSDGSNHDLAFEVLNSLKTEDLLHLVETEGSQHHTQPPPRYSEASLVKKLEELGIGRPSTYASTLRVLQDRKYVTVKSRVLSPEFRGRMVSAFLSHHFSEVTDYSFTADMETELDNVSAGITKWKGLLGDYWTRFKSYCERTSNVHIHQVEKMLEKKFADYLFGSLPDKSRVCPSCNEGTLIFKVSRFGAGYFIGCDQHPRCKYIAKTLYGNDDDGDDDDEEDTPKQNTMIEEPKLLGFNSANEKILLKSGPYGIYIQLGEDRKGHPPKRVSVPHVKDVDSITLEDALVLLQYPLTLGKHPQDGNPVELKVATRGYSIWHGSKIAPVPKALEMLMLVESKGLYFCNHHMFRFWYSNDMLHIRKILEEAKKKDSKLTVALLYHALIVGYCKLQQFDRALKLLTEMKDFGVLYTNLDEYHKLIHSFCLMDMEWKLAIEQLEEMEPMDREMVEDELHTMATMDKQMVEERLEEMSEEQLEEVRISMQKYLS